MSDTVRVSRSLLIVALDDAIDYAASFLEAHNPKHAGGASCCEPFKRCDAYEAAARRLDRYRREMTRIAGPRREPEGTSVTLTELMQRGEQT